jgi:DNA-binding NtrC family response regulator
MAKKVVILGDVNEIVKLFQCGEWTEEFKEFPAHHCDSLQETLPRLAAKQADCLVLVSSETFPEAGVDSSDILECVQGIDPGLPVIFISGRASAAEAVRLVRAGAWNCFGQGDSFALFRDSLESALEQRRKLRRDENWIAGNREPWREILVGDSLAMESVAETIRLVGPRRCTVLISGETGTGKEMAARAIHMASPRAHLNMVSVNCTALPENLLEAELFGHTRGAFTGASGHRIGRFEQAHKSTLFLDEIGDLPMELQAKLLRVLQEREFQRLGSSETIKVDVRVIAATNVGLQEKVRQGKFREDLYYRLNVVPLRMPALRNRVSDIPSLVSHFVKKICQNEDIPLKRLAPESLEHLSAGQWPGNVRQLENLVEMAIAMTGDRDVIFPVDFGFSGPRLISIPNAGNLPMDLPTDIGFEAAVNRFQVGILENALQAAGGNKTMAAERLGMKRTTLIMKIRTLQQSGLLTKAG